MKKAELIQGIIGWNKRFPLDRWWRAKHNIAFMSPEHRKSSFLYQLMEFEEDKLFLKTAAPEDPLQRYIPNIGDMFKVSVSQEAFLDEAEREIEEMLKQEGEKDG